MAKKIQPTWTDEMNQKLMEIYPTEPWEIIDSSFPFARDAIVCQASRLKIRRRRCGFALYSEEEIETIKRGIQDGLNTHEIQKLLPWRTVSSIATKAGKMNLLQRREWTDEEHQILMSLYPTMSVDEVLPYLPGRTYNAVVGQAQKLGVQAYKPYHHYTDAENAFIKENYTFLSDAEMGEILGHPRESIKNHRNKLGCHRQNRANISYENTSIYVRRHNKTWKDAAMVSCSYRCCLTGDRFDDIHHLVSMNQILDEVYVRLQLDKESFDINSVSSGEREMFMKVYWEEQAKYPCGVCLRHDVHMSFHREYGFGDNTPEQFYEFVERYYPNRQLNVA